MCLQKQPQESPYTKEKDNQTTHQLPIPLRKVHMHLPNFQKTSEAQYTGYINPSIF